MNCSLVQMILYIHELKVIAQHLHHPLKRLCVLWKPSLWPCGTTDLPSITMIQFALLEVYINSICEGILLVWLYLI